MSAPDRLAPDSSSLADAAASWRGAYVHIPFCSRVCPYCDFAVVAGRDDLVARYVAAVAREIEMEPAFAPLQAVHFGGGTPSHLSAPVLGALLEALDRRFGIDSGAEIALEANPEDWHGPTAAAVRTAGFNRVSLGVQSFDPAVLRALGRAHTAEEAGAAVAASHDAGFDSVGFDLIFGAPAESDASWELTLGSALALGPDHLSTYGLTVERGTPLSREVAAGAPAPDPDVQAGRYETAQRSITAAGLVRYEVSNYALPGHHSRYNLSTWSMGDYVAFGLGAHDHRERVRRRNLRRLDAYLAAVESGATPEAGRECLDAWGREQERLFVGLRRVAGVPVGTGGAALVGSDWGRRLVAAGILETGVGRIRVVKPLLTDEVARAVSTLSGGLLI